MSWNEKVEELCQRQNLARRRGDLMPAISSLKRLVELCRASVAFFDVSAAHLGYEYARSGRGALSTRPW